MRQEPTRAFSIRDEKEYQIRQVLTEVYEALNEKKIKYNSVTYNNLNVNPLDFNFPRIHNLLENPHSRQL